MQVRNVSDYLPDFSNVAPDMDTNLSTALIILVLSIACLSLLLREWNRHEKQISELTKRVRALEQANLQRLPYKSFEEILNGMAALEILEREAEFKTDVIQNAKAHLANAMKVGTKREVKSTEK